MNTPLPEQGRPDTAGGSVPSVPGGPLMDPFEWAQARMPDGWHVEGQVLPIMRAFSGHQEIEGGWFATATRNDADKPCDCVFGDWFRRDGRGGVTLRGCRRHRPILAYGYTPGWALANLVRKVSA